MEEKPDWSRSRRIWKAAALVLGAIVLVELFIAVLFSVPNLT
jgi:putative transcriptional regulator